MPFWPLLLRMLLIAALVLNGTGVATASMHGTHASTVAADPASTSSAGHACHEGVEAGMTVADEAPQSAVSDQAHQAQHPAPDCCSQTACGCACVGAQAAAPPASIGDAEPRSDRLASLVLQGHVEPATLHLIRPPIG